MKNYTWSPFFTELLSFICDKYDKNALASEFKFVFIGCKGSHDKDKKRLKSYIEKYNPKIAIRTSMADYKQTDCLYVIPLYGIKNI